MRGVRGGDRADGFVRAACSDYCCLVISVQDAIRPAGADWIWQSSIRFGASMVPNV
jgi:hypothetical protein